MFPSVQTNISDIRNALAESKDSAPEKSGNLNYLVFSGKRNEWQYGSDKEDVAGDSLLINVASFTHGWILWNNRKCTTDMVSIINPLPAQLEPVEKPNGDLAHASEGRGFQGRFLDSEEIVSFESGSLGGRQAVSEVIGEVKAKAISGSEFIFPLVSLDSDSYTNRNGDLVYTPVLKIVGWYDQEGNEEGVKAVEKKAPKRKKAPAKKAAEPAESMFDEAEAEAEEEVSKAPIRRRRRA